VPAVAGVHATVYGAVNTGPPIAIPFAKKATLVTVAPGVGDPEAVTVTGVPTVPALLLAGLLRATVGADTTVAVSAVEVAILPLESRTRAVTEKFPVLEGVQVIRYGAVVTVPITVAEPPVGVTLNCTCETVAPVLAVAVADTTVGVLRVMVAPPAGAVSATVGWAMVAV